MDNELIAAIVAVLLAAAGYDILTMREVFNNSL